MKGIGMKNWYGVCATAAVTVAAGLLQGCIANPYHAQNFAAGEVDLEGKQLYFIPTPSDAFYERQVVDITELGNDPTGDTVADVSGGSDRIVVGLANAVNFYGQLYGTIFVGADGAIGMGQVGDNSGVVAHFMQPQISLLPVDEVGDGRISYEVVDGDSIAITYEGVTAGGAPATAQAEFLLRSGMEGDIALSYLEISPDAAGMVGLSNAQLAGASQQQINDFVADFEAQPPLTTTTMTGSLF